PYYVPQHFGQFNSYTVARALQIEDKLYALQRILEGEVTEAHMDLLADDWSVEERCREALACWGLDGLDPGSSMAALSGGQKTRVFLAGIQLHRPALVLMDEPSNHLDSAGREILYRYIRNTTDTLLIVSHDRTLLNLLHTVCALNKQGISRYGGNYDFYLQQKEVAGQAFQDELQDKEKALRKARQTERIAAERQQKLDARGQKKQEKAGLPTISMNTLRNNAEKSTAKTKEVHADKTAKIAGELNTLRKALPAKDKIKMGFDDPDLHRGKLLIDGRQLNYAYEGQALWATPLDIRIFSGDRIALKGGNGTGKTTLVRLILGELTPASGTMERSGIRCIYIDQDYSLVRDGLSVYEQAQRFNSAALEEHEVKRRLTHFLLTEKHWHKACATLSGGEKMRLLLCCLSLGQAAPELIVLDEPTNNLDLQNIEILTEAIQQYRGTLIVISHDRYFLEQIGAGTEFVLS
ncbi:MAG: ABC-F family ATP-binding cassette domain-containing protein, partial [Chitinophagaceae bacterium]|nr:ABC-F family ATP-binding cassette domain-containing protein [Chitinophagaceae bacterium]